MRPTSRRGTDDGFTLVELLVTMVLSLLVLFVALQAAESFARSARAADQTARAQEDARAAVRQIVQALRQGRADVGRPTPVAPASTPTRGDLVVAAHVRGADDPAPGPLAGWLRYCATAPGAGGSLVVGIRAQETWADPGACRPGSSGGWTQVAVVAGTLQRGDRLFDYGGGGCVGGAVAAGAPATACVVDPARITTVGIRVAVGRDRTGAAAGAVVLRAAVSFRNGGTP